MARIVNSIEYHIFSFFIITNFLYCRLFLVEVYSNKLDDFDDLQWADKLFRSST